MRSLEWFVVLSIANNWCQCWFIAIITLKMKKEERIYDRYDGNKGNQFFEYVSKEFKARTSKNTNVTLYLMAE